EHGHNANEMTKWLQRELLGMDMSMFKQTVIIGDDAAYLVRAAGERGRTECLDKMFGLEVLSQIRQALVDRVKELQEEVGKLKTQHAQLLYRSEENNQQRDSLIMEINAAEKYEKALNAQLEALCAKL